MPVQSLNNALTGLRAAQNAINLTSHNIANASTPGYTRKILPQEASFTDVNALGVRIGEVLRSVDMSLIRELVGQTSQISGLDVREQYLSRIQAYHGASEAESSIGAVLNNLKEDFISLSSEPESGILLNNVVSSAQETARLFNDFSSTLQQLRNETQTDISASVTEVNGALENVATLNLRIAKLAAAGQSTADLEDQRDAAISLVAEHLSVSYFRAENNKIVLMTANGQTLADTEARRLVFNPTQQSATSFYPGGGSAGLFIDSTTGIELTGGNIGGKIGSLFALRDETLPQYQAQLDELAQKTAERFATQGLELFTDALGNVPASVAPPGAVGYVGFAAEIRVNATVVADPTLVRSGTTGATVPSGSNEVIRKIIDFTFGAFTGQQAIGTVDISAGTIFAATGLSQFAQIIGTADITDLGILDSHPDIAPGAQFTIDVGGGPALITINAGDTATDLVNNINAALPGTARLNSLGQIVLEAGADITVTAASLTAAGLAALGLTAGVTPAQDPSFTISAGLNSPVTIFISPTDTQANLLADLNAVPGVTASLGPGGVLLITPDDGGDIALTNGLGDPLVALGVSVVGTPHTAFREDNLGPNADIATQLVGFTSLVQFAQGLVSQHGETYRNTQKAQESEQLFYDTLENRFLNESGVDLDQELARLIELQTAYSAAARAISVSEELFNTLLNAF
ncbi:MAG: flagellar hook-associated protein FlgK [Pseudomonadota bacterium]|nr:MAG: flagellar hook-associated protein FlgK [Pseudomonadota bacterium]